jgi:hypothetical protein
MKNPTNPATTRQITMATTGVSFMRLPPFATPMHFFDDLHRVRKHTKNSGIGQKYMQIRVEIPPHASRIVRVPRMLARRDKPGASAQRSYNRGSATHSI